MICKSIKHKKEYSQGMLWLFITESKFVWRDTENVNGFFCTREMAYLWSCAIKTEKLISRQHWASCIQFCSWESEAVIFWTNMPYYHRNLLWTLSQCFEQMLPVVCSWNRRRRGGASCGWKRRCVDRASFKEVRNISAAQSRTDLVSTNSLR